MGSYIQKVIGSNENITGSTKLHWVIFVGPFAVIIFGLVILIFSNFLPINIHIFIKILVIIPGVIFWTIVWLIRNTTEYVSTNKRVLIKKGIISRYVSEIYLNKIEGALVTQSILGRIFNYGTLQIRGVGGNLEEYSFINDPFIFQKTIKWK